MNCSVCGKELEKVREDESVNTNTNVIYLRTVYHCEEDDVWITIETPKLVNNN
jgi:hypothetical protein